MGLRRILHSDRLRDGLCALAALHIRLVHVTSRWRVVRGHIPAALWDRGTPFILCFWHGRLLMMPYCWRRHVPIHMLISSHRDGQLIARTVRHFGIDTVAGSTSRGGGQAVRAMTRCLRAGECVGITPDGPRGPRMRASPGAIAVARLSGAPLVPAAFAARRRRVLGTWDRFVLALPFTRGVFVWGEPLTVPADADEAAMERARGDLESRLNAVTREADLACGRTPVEPAPAPARAGDAAEREAGAPAPAQAGRAGGAG